MMNRWVGVKQKVELRIRSSHLRSQDGARGGTSRACTPPPKPKLLKEELRNTGNDQNRDGGRDWQLGVAFSLLYNTIIEVTVWICLLP